MNALLINPADNVVVVTEAIQPGDTVTYRDGDEMKSIQATQAVPIYHKIAIREIPWDSRVLKYAHQIGVAQQDIHVGEYVHCHNVQSPSDKEVYR